MIIKNNNLLIKVVKKLFNQKSKIDSEFFDFIMNNLNKDSGKSNPKSKRTHKFEEQPEKDKYKFSKEKNYFKLKDKILSPKIKHDMMILKLQDGFTSNDLRQKFLSLAKLYHPDVLNSDSDANNSFLKLKESYERLKIYLAYKDNLNELERNVSSEDGNITFNYGTLNYSDILNTQDSKENYIKTLLLEDEFGDIKEPRHILQYIFFIWIFTGIIIFYIDIKSYIKGLCQKRINVDYDIKTLDIIKDQVKFRKL